MEFSGNYGGRAGFLWLTFCIFLTLSSAQPLENPLKNVNLSPFWQWRSAYDCLQNTSTKCGANKLTLSGVIQVNGSSEVADYCNNGCAQWTRDVLNCISWVKRDFYFSNNATVQQINYSIANGCNTNSPIMTISFPRSSGMRNFGGTHMALFSALVLSIFLFSA